MASQETQALVLRTAEYHDYDRMVTLFSPDMGRIDAIARGCRRPKSPLVSAVAPFTAGTWQLYFGRERCTIEQCAVTESFLPIRKDYDRLLHGVYWLKLLETSIQPDVPAEDVFLMTLRALAHLSYSDIDPALLTMAFEMHLTARLGFSPRMDACVICGRPVDGDCRFDADLGGAVCERHISDAPRITNAVRRIIMKLPRTQFDKFQLLDGHPNWPEAAKHFRSYVNLKMHMDKFAPPLYGEGTYA